MRTLAWAVGARDRCARGFTLVEIVVAFAVLATLAAIGLPSYAAWLADARLGAFAQQLAWSMNLARAEAVRAGGRVVLCKAAAGTRTCSTMGGWDGGWIVFVDADGNARADAGDAIVRVEPPAQHGIVARGNQPVASYISYTAYGQARLTSGGLQMGTITVCKSGLRAWQVVLASTGRVRTERGTDVCP